jgi:hypothetical protein
MRYSVISVLPVSIICTAAIALNLQASPISGSTPESDRRLPIASVNSNFRDGQPLDSEASSLWEELDTLITPTNEWINLFCADPMIDGVPLQTGDTVAAYDPDGIICGIDIVRDNGSFGFMPVYRDDIFTEDDEGADPGDTITFRVNGVVANPVPAVVWTANGDGIETCIFETAAGEVTGVYLDVKPGSCPNPLNVKANLERGKSVLPVAVLGTDDMDVRDINPMSVTLEGVSPARWSYEDVATPVHAPEDECDCTDMGPDGYEDLTLKFLRSQLVTQLGDLVDRQTVVLTVSGLFYDGTEFTGSDCILILGDGNAGSDKLDLTDGEQLTTSVRPNPFNPTTAISFVLPAAGNVRLDVYNVAGQLLVTLVDAYLPAGEHSYTWDAGDRASGVYFYRIRTDSAVETRKMMLLK